jgi:hypothetical protein
MKSKIWVVAVMGLLATSLSATVAAAQCTPAPAETGVMIKFDADAWAYETAYTSATFSSAAGSQLTVVGIVSKFCYPFADLDPADPNTEYTFIWDGLTSVGTTSKPYGLSGTQYTSRYVGGGFRIYAGSPRNAPTAAAGLPDLPDLGVVPDAFTDGTMILGGVMTDTLFAIVTRSSTGTYTNSFRANYQCTSGTLYYRIDNGISLISGAWCAVPPNNPDPPYPLGTCQLPVGWSAHLNGKWDTPSTVPTMSSTWGKIKTLYR